MDSLVKDLRYGYRTLLKNPGLTSVALLSLALGIGANTAIFSLINTLLLKPLPMVAAPEELVVFGEGVSRGNMSGPGAGSMRLFSWREYQDFERSTSTFRGVLALNSSPQRVYAAWPGSEPEGLNTALVSGNFFAVLGVTPAAGRFFDHQVDRAAGSGARAVLSDDYWNRRFRRDPEVVGRSFRVGDRVYTVDGVAPPGFFGTYVGEAPDLWIPVTMQGQLPNSDGIDLNDTNSHFLHIIARRKGGVARPVAAANVNAVYRQMLLSYAGTVLAPADQTRIAGANVPLTDGSTGITRLRGRYAAPLVILMILVAAVLFIACANVANLLVSLGAKRRREIAIRAAIGAGVTRVVRQLLTESMILSLAGGGLGLLIAAPIDRILVHLISTGPAALPFAFQPDARVLIFTALLCVLTGLVFGIAPAIQASGVNVISALKEGKANNAARGGARFSRAVVVGQVALSLTLLMNAGLLIRSLSNLENAGTGFDRTNVILFKIDSESSGFAQDEKLAAMYSRIERQVGALPGVAAAALALRSFNEGNWNEGLQVPGENPSPENRTTSLNAVDEHFFSALGIPLIAGRAFSDRDHAAAPLVTVVSASFAKKIFGGGNPIGRTIEMAPFTAKNLQYRVIGVVGDIKTNDVRDVNLKLAYLPLLQRPVYAGTLAVRATGNTRDVIAGVRAALRLAAPTLPIRRVTTLETEVRDSLVRERAVAQLSAVFAGLAMLLAALGLYGTLSFAVSRRTGEIGIQMAMGAGRGKVLRRVMAESLSLACMGFAIGLPMSIAAGIALRSLLFGLGSFDPTSAAAAVSILCLIAILAGYLPARRAASVDPMTALRYE